MVAARLYNLLLKTWRIELKIHLNLLPSELLFTKKYLYLLAQYHSFQVIRVGRFHLYTKTTGIIGRSDPCILKV